jgi:hypothetical protein
MHADVHTQQGQSLPKNPALFRVRIGKRELKQ